MVQPICIVGTDTDVGKTYISCEILRYLIDNGLHVAAMKPISAGVVASKYGPINEDVYKLFEVSNIKLLFNLINPFSLELAIAPHIAALKCGVSLSVDKITTLIEELVQKLKIDNKCNWLLLEGAGGIMVPLNSAETYLDLLIRLNYPVILVVGMKLGCLNHTLLTYNVLRAKQINIVGFIANAITREMPYLNENIDFLRNKLEIPLLATVPHNGRIKATKDFLKYFT